MSRPMVPLKERLFSRIEKADGCWTWLGPHDKYGYGAIGAGGRGGRVLKVHALVYTMLVGEIPRGKEIHHKCENKGCCNPDHLVTLTRSEHISITPRRYVGRTGRKASHCIHGHPFDEANTYIWKGTRTCRACNLRHTYNRRHNPKSVPAKERA